MGKNEGNNEQMLNGEKIGEKMGKWRANVESESVGGFSQSALNTAQ